MDSPQQISQQLQEIIDQVIAVITTYGLNVLGAIAILILGWIAAGWAKSAVAKALNRVKMVDEMLSSFFSSMVKYIILAFTVVAVLNRFGVETTSFVAVIGAAGLAIGLALQGTLSNVAAGVMLLLFRPFRVGHFVEGAGLAGTIKATGLFTTEMATGDNIHIVVPNSQLWGAAIRNFSHHPARRIDLTIGIGYGDDIDKAMDAIKHLASSDERVYAEPAPFVEVGNLGDSAVELVVRVWADNGNYWPVRFALLKAIKQTFDKEGISFPFPQRDVHLHQV
ncbi:mechanosensitive ion channel family protein [Magnetovibrio blakemorei]|uniref:Small-conductance mechanosensitive channel n=1 Tax=Magnetovibrio blakemorei TaxID=28181 RepID=A0A1E5QBZ4_9PROT|nr:mechanosensitive ion channel domain-containing protein [Magnetovibrio blakemorei]OEJ69608.1 mechanosensitive ion channel protein MscS [Magnetovibrio blakemorei]